MGAMTPATLAHLIRHFMELTAARTLCQVSKCTLDRRQAGNTACWLIGLEACWGFKAAMSAVDDLEASDPCANCGESRSRHSSGELADCADMLRDATEVR